MGQHKYNKVAIAHDEGFDDVAEYEKKMQNRHAWWRNAFRKIIDIPWKLKL